MCAWARTAVFSSLYNNGGGRVTAHHRGSQCEVFPCGRGVGEEWAEYHPPLSGFLLELPAAPRAVVVDPSSKHSHSPASSAEDSSVRHRVDPRCQSADDCDVPLDERFGDAAHDCSASRGRSARSDNGDGTTVMGDCAFGEDHWRHFVDFAERRWIVVLPKGVDTDSVRGTLVQQSSGFGDRTLKWTVFGAAGHVPRPESLL